MTENAWGEDGKAEAERILRSAAPSVFSLPQNKEAVPTNGCWYSVPGTPLCVQVTKEHTFIACGYDRGQPGSWKQGSAYSEIIAAYWVAKRYCTWQHGLTNAGLRDYGDFLVRLWAVLEEQGEEYLEAAWRLGGEDAVRPLFGSWPEKKKEPK